MLLLIELPVQQFQKGGYVGSTGCSRLQSVRTASAKVDHKDLVSGLIFDEKESGAVNMTFRKMIHTLIVQRLSDFIVNENSMKELFFNLPFALVMAIATSVNSWKDPQEQHPL